MTVRVGREEFTHPSLHDIASWVDIMAEEGGSVKLLICVYSAWHCDFVVNRTFVRYMFLRMGQVSSKEMWDWSTNGSEVNLMYPPISHNNSCMKFYAYVWRYWWFKHASYFCTRLCQTSQNLNFRCFECQLVSGTNQIAP